MCGVVARGCVAGTGQARGSEDQRGAMRSAPSMRMVSPLR